MNKMIDLNILPLETLAEMANEKAEQVQNNAKKTVADAMDCGRYLEAAKEQVEDGQWLAWLGANWNYSRRTATTYMRLASHGKRFPCVEYESIREAMTMIALDTPEQEEEKTVPRSERKTGQVEVVEPDEPDDDPTPDPPTIRKTAKCSEKVKEADKPKTAAITPELIDEPKEDDPFAYTTFVGCLDIAETKIDASDAKAVKGAAKIYRKRADKFDPPTKFVKPDLEEVSAYFTELKAVDPDSFFDFYESKGWLVGKVSMKDWRASARKWVRENQSNGKGNGNGSAHRGSGKRGLTAEDVFS